MTCWGKKGKKMKTNNPCDCVQCQLGRVYADMFERCDIGTIVDDRNRITEIFKKSGKSDKELAYLSIGVATDIAASISQGKPEIVRKLRAYEIEVEEYVLKERKESFRAEMN